MKRIFFITVLIAVSLSHATAQSLGSIDNYLEDPKVHQGAKDYYNETVKATADDSTARIADSMLTKNDTVRPFYMLLVSKMFIYADADLAMMLFPRCYTLLDQRPDDIMEFLYCDDKFVQSEFKNYWATAIAFQFRKERPGDVKENLDNMKAELTEKCKKKQREHLNDFLGLVAKRL